MKNRFRHSRSWRRSTAARRENRNCLKIIKIKDRRTKEHEAGHDRCTGSGSTENTVLARAIRSLGVYSEIYPHDITPEELKALPNVKGIILYGGPNHIVDGVRIDVNPEIYGLGIPVMSIAHELSRAETAYAAWEEAEPQLKAFVFDTCGAEANWNMKNFVEDQVELIRRQVGDKKVLLALSGGVDSSVVAALLIRAIGRQLVCVHVNHGLMRKGESESVIEVFKNQMDANLIYVDATERYLTKLAGVADPEQKRKIIGASLSASSRRRPESWRASISWRREPFTRISWRAGRRRRRS